MLAGTFGHKRRARLSAKGWIGLGYGENGFRHETNTRRPINTADDLAGLKLRVIQSPLFLDTFNDNRRGYELVVNPLGVQGDLIRDETNTNNQEDPSWDGLWTSAGQLTAEGYDVEIRRIICSTNAIESLNARYRRAVRARGHFPNDAAALKCLYLVTRSLDPTGRGRARWVTRWKPALNAFAIDGAH